MKKALITGITGQDGSYLAEFLISKNYKVYGLVRRHAIENLENRFSRISPILDKVILCDGDINEFSTLAKLIAKIKPDECYHLAAQSFVDSSFADEFSTFTTNISGTHYLLSALREFKKDCKFYFAGSSEMFGSAVRSPQDEGTEFNPVSPYGISKTTGFYLTKMYRDCYGLFACGGIAFSHESPRRGSEFVTRKITYGAAQIKLGLAKKLILGNLDARRDWGYAGDYVEAMWLMLQQNTPSDYIIASGETHSVREFAEEVFKHLGLDFTKYVRTDKKFFRVIDSRSLCGNASKARKILGWKPKVKFKELVTMMADADLARLSAR